MARIRTIKPEFWTDDKTGILTDKAKCLFIGLLNLSDDYGVLEFKLNEWRIKIFPYDYHTTTGVLQKIIVDEFFATGLLEMFFIKEDENYHGKQYVFVKNFAKHQVINKPSNPLLKGWQKHDTPESYAKRLGIDFEALGQEILQHDSYTTTTPLPEYYFPERKGKERKGKEHNNILPKKQKPTSLPENFQISERVENWIKEKKYKPDWVQKNFEKFIGYAKAHGKQYVDWDEALMTAIRDNWAQAIDLYSDGSLF